MANTYAYFKNYVTLLDEVYKNAAKTAALESDATLAKEGANANEIIIPKLDMDGLGNYDRNSGYTGGDVTMTNETVKFNYERGSMFTVDNMDNEETAGIAFGRLAGEFIRTKVVPEIDAVRFAKYASTEGITTAEETYATGESVLLALQSANSEMDNQEVPMEDRYLYITPTLLDMARYVDLIKCKEVLNTFAGIERVPQSRFYSAVTLNDGITEGQKQGGYTKADGAKELNFLIIHKPAILQFTKHVAPKVISPEVNQTADAYKFGYRIYGLNEVYENKRVGIYASMKPEGNMVKNAAKKA